MQSFSFHCKSIKQGIKLWKARNLERKKLCQFSLKCSLHLSLDVILFFCKKTSVTEMKAEDSEIWKREINFTNWILFFSFQRLSLSTCQLQLSPVESKDLLLRMFHFDQLPANCFTGCTRLQLGWRVSLPFQLSRAAQRAQKTFLCLELPSLATAQFTAHQSLGSAGQEDARLHFVSKLSIFTLKYWPCFRKSVLCFQILRVCLLVLTNSHL